MPKPKMIVPCFPPPNFECMVLFHREKAEKKALVNWIKEDMAKFRKSQLCSLAANELHQGRALARELLNNAVEY